MLYFLNPKRDLNRHDWPSSLALSLTASLSPPSWLDSHFTIHRDCSPAVFDVSVVRDASAGAGNIETKVCGASNCTKCMFIWVVYVYSVSWLDGVLCARSFFLLVSICKKSGAAVDKRLTIHFVHDKTICAISLIFIYDTSLLQGYSTAYKLNQGPT